jgi:hypothetical protein
MIHTWECKLVHDGSIGWSKKEQSLDTLFQEVDSTENKWRAKRCIAKHGEAQEREIRISQHIEA